MSARRMTCTLAGFLALGCSLASIAAADDVALVPGSSIKAPGNRIRGTVSAETATDVKIDSQTVPVDQIASINYTGQPANFTLAETRESAGGLAEAADLYQKAASDAAGKEFIVRAAQFGRARVLADLAQGDPSRMNQAFDALDAFLKAHPSSRQQGPALEALARLSIQKGDYDRAAKALSDLGKVPWAADRAAVLQARVLARKGEYDKAVKALDAMMAKTDKESPKYREAQLAKAECLAGLKKFNEAEAAVQSVIKAASPEDAETQALAHNTLGECYKAAGRPKDALLAYLHTDILYSKDKELHAKALVEIAKLWRELRRDDRADEVAERLKQEYPNLSAAGGKR